MARESCCHGWPHTNLWGPIWAHAESPWEGNLPAGASSAPHCLRRAQLMPPHPSLHLSCLCFLLCLSHFKAFLRAAPNAAAGVRFGKAVPWAGKPSATACRPLQGRVWGNRRRWQGGFVPLVVWPSTAPVALSVHPWVPSCCAEEGVAKGCWCEREL